MSVTPEEQNLKPAPSAPGDGRGGGRVVTFGCRLNAYESEIIRAHLATAGRDDVIVVNTCAVTAESERQARQAIRKLRRHHPEAELVVTGCAAQTDPTQWATMPEVSRVIGNREKLLRPTYGGSISGHAQGDNAQTGDVQVGDIMQARRLDPDLPDAFAGRARAFLQVQNGCDHRCTFCIIPYGRGPSRSLAPDAVIDAVRRLVAQGCRELVLSGVDITAYGSDLDGRPGLGALVRRLLKHVPELPRLRISSVDCIELDDDIMRAMAEEERLMPHLHLSLQSGDDMILKRMKRRHSRADGETLITRLRDLRPDIVFGADLIAGFPTESEAMFENSLAMIRDWDLTWLHVFPYSPRAGTPAARIPDQVPVALRRERARRLRAAGDAAAARYLVSLVGTKVQVLVERLMDGAAFGHGEGFAPVRIDGAALQIGDCRAVRITSVGADGVARARPDTAAAA